jgi:hypothetical protein
MRRKLIWIAPLAIVAIAAFAFLGGWVVQHLWNWLVPALFGWRMVTFWQALGLLALCRILFGSWCGRSGGRSTFRRRMDEKWDRMTPEEREKARQKWGGRCGFGEPGGGTKEPA